MTAIAEIVWHGQDGTFAAALEARRNNSQGEPLRTHDVDGWASQPGQAFWWPSVAGDGTLCFPGQPQTSNAFLPTGKNLLAYFWNPDEHDGLYHVVVPTSTGVTEPLSVGYGSIVGGADFEDSQLFTDSLGVEHIVCPVQRTYNDWDPDVGGEYPPLAIFTRNATTGLWEFDAAKSPTAAAHAASNPTAAANILYSGSAPLFPGKTVWSARGPVECCLLPASNTLILAHYNDAAGLGFNGGALTAWDLSTGTPQLLDGYLIPNITYHGASVSARPRGLESNPAGVIGDEEFSNAYDAFGSGYIDEGLVLDGTANTVVTTPDTADLNVVGVMEGTLRVKVVDWTTPADQLLFGHWDITSNQRSWGLFINATTGLLSFRGSSTGSTVSFNSPSTAPGVADNALAWIGWKYDTGAGTLAFYRAADATSEPARWGASWTAIGTATPGPLTFFNSSAALSLGGTGSFFTALLKGTIYQAHLYDDGVEVVRAVFDGTTMLPFSSTVTDPGGRVWTMRGAAYLDGVDSGNSPVQVFTFDSTTNTIKAKSKSFFLADAKSQRPVQTGWTDDGDLWVAPSFSGLFFGLMHVFHRVAGVLSVVTAQPATDTPWLDGSGSATTEWGVFATADATVTDSSHGAGPVGMVWDEVDDSMAVMTGTSGLLRIPRTGPAGSHGYGPTTIHGDRQSDQGSAVAPIKPIIDRPRGLVWSGMRGIGGTPHPKPPTVIPNFALSFQLPSGAPQAAAVMTITQVLEGVVPQRTEGMRWDVLDRDRNVVGALMVARDHVPHIENDTTRPVRRSISDMMIAPRPVYDVDTSHIYAGEVNPLRQLVMPWWVYSTGDEFPLGLFGWGSDAAEVWSWGEPRHATLADLMSELDQPLDRAVGYAAGTSVYDALVDCCDQENIPASDRNIEACDCILSVAVGGAPGRDTRLSVMETLCRLAGFFPPYRDNRGVLTCRSAPDLATAAADFAYGPGTVVREGSPLLSSDILTAPNRYVVIGGNPSAELVGTFDIPDAAPNSFVNRGKLVRKTIDLQGIETQAQADTAAAAAYAADSSTYSWLSFETPVDPRQDTFDILSFVDVNYRQLRWAIECKVGGIMQHDVRGTYG